MSSAKETKQQVETNGVGFWWFLRELCRVAKVDRGKEHSLLMHQCTTEVLCNLAGLIFRLAFTLPEFS